MFAILSVIFVIVVILPQLTRFFFGILNADVSVGHAIVVIVMTIFVVKMIKACLKPKKKKK